MCIYKSIYRDIYLHICDYRNICICTRNDINLSLYIYIYI